MNALITGGCGFVGSNLAAHLLSLDLSDRDQANKVTVFDNLSRHGASANLTWLRTLSTTEHNAIEFIHGDIRNAFDVEADISIWSRQRRGTSRALRKTEWTSLWRLNSTLRTAAPKERPTSTCRTTREASD